MTKRKLLNKWKRDLSKMEFQRQSFMNDRFRFATQIEELDEDIEMLENIIYDLEFEILSDSNIM